MNINDIVYLIEADGTRVPVYNKGRVWNSKGNYLMFRRVTEGPGRGNAAEPVERFRDAEGNQLS